MANPGDFAYTVKQQADIVRIIGEYVKLKKSGAQNFTGLCPFHNEKTGSFSVHATRQFYHCFGCGASGDVLSFVQKVESITFPEAVRLVAQKAGIPLPKQSYSGPAEAREARLRGVLLDVHERACAWFEEQLLRTEGTHAREYLAARGLNDEGQRRFRIGYAPDSGFLLRDALKREFDEETLRASGLFSWKQSDEDRGPSPSGTPAAGGRAQDDKARAAMYSRFRNRVMFPIANESGKVIAFTGRALASDNKAGPKYLNSPETAIYSKSRVLYNLDRAKEAIRKLDYVILVEGQMDCISVDIAGFHNVIASSGTAFTEHQVRLLARFTRNIVVNFDPDTAGAAAAERSIAGLVAEEFRIKVVTLEPGLDPDLFLRQRGREAYAAALKGAQKYFDYLIERAQAQFAVRSAEGKVAAVNWLLPHLQRVPQRIVRDELAADMAQKLGIASAVLRQELRHAAATRASTVKTVPEAQVTDGERIVIRALAGSAEMAAAASDLRRQAQFTLAEEGLHHGLASEALLEALLGDADADAVSLELPEADRRLLAGILMREEEELTEELLAGALAALRRRRLERQQQHLKTQIVDAERRNDGRALTELMQEKLRIDRALAAS